MTKNETTQTKAEKKAQFQKRVDKQKVFYRGYFLGRGMFESLRALEVALECHKSSRKDGSPEISHQFEIVGMILQVFEKWLDVETLDMLIAASFLHDVAEDYSELYPISLLATMFKCGTMDILVRVTKPKDFVKDHVNRTHYYDYISEKIWAIIMKCFDRIHNLQSMVAGFSVEKQHAYIEETETYFYPMIKKARAAYPEMYMVLITLQQQMEMIIRLASYSLDKKEKELKPDARFKEAEIGFDNQ